MPSVNFDIDWPDGELQSYYSPSTIIHDFIRENEAYEQPDFAEKIFQGLDQASERVYKKFGYYCSAAMDEKSKIKQKLDELKAKNNTGVVRVVSVK